MMVQAKKKKGMKLKTKFKIFLILLLLALAILLLKELMEFKMNQDLIIKRVNLQTTQIETLEIELHQTQSQLSLEELKVQQLQREISYLNGESYAPVDTKTSSVDSEEEKPKFGFNLPEMHPLAPVVGVGILQVLKVVFRIPVPI